MAEKCIKCSKKQVCSGFCRSHFIEYFEKKVRKTIRKYKLLKTKDKILVAASGGKDSSVLLIVLSKLGYKIEAVNINPDIGKYTDDNISNLKKVCEKYKIPLHIISFQKELGMPLKKVKEKAKKNGKDMAYCMICGIFKRYLLNKFARENKYDVICTGHNMDDEAQAFVMNVFRNDIKLAKRQGPVSGTGKNKKFVKRIKPLYMMSEKEIITYSKLMKIPAFYGICPYSENAYRRVFLNFLNEFEKSNPNVKNNIVQFFLNNIKPKNITKQVEINSCKYCGEPTANNVCKACEILRLVEE